MAKKDDTSKGKRGRPRERNAAPRIAFTDFMCVYANGVAQVYQRTQILPRAPKDCKDPVAHIARGDYIIIYFTLNEYGLKANLYTTPVHVSALARKNTGRLADQAPNIIDRATAEAIAERLWREADEDTRFGWLEGYGAHIVYRNEHYEVSFSNQLNQEIPVPFIIVHTKDRTVVGETKARPRRFRTLHSAIDSADKLSREETKRLIRYGLR